MNESTNGSGDGASFSIGALLGKHGRGGGPPLLETFERKVRFYFYQGCVKEGSGNGHLSSYGPHWGTLGGRGLLTAD